MNHELYKSTISVHHPPIDTNADVFNLNTTLVAITQNTQYLDSEGLLTPQPSDDVNARDDVLAVTKSSKTPTYSEKRALLTENQQELLDYCNLYAVLCDHSKVKGLHIVSINKLSINAVYNHTLLKFVKKFKTVSSAEW